MPMTIKFPDLLSLQRIFQEVNKVANSLVTYDYNIINECGEWIGCQLLSVDLQKGQVELAHSGKLHTMSIEDFMEKAQAYV